MNAVLPQFLARMKDLVARTPTFGGAVSLSVLLHVLFLALFGLLLAFLDTPMLDKPPVVLDFVYSPTKSANENGLPGDNLQTREVPKLAARRARASGSAIQPAEKRARPADNNLNSPETAALRKTLRMRSETELTRAPRDGASDAPPAGLHSASAESPERETLPDLATDLRRPEPVLSTEALTSFAVPRSAPATPLAPAAKIKMDRRTRKMLVKKFRKWSEDFCKMDLPDSTLTWRHKGRAYVARFRHRPVRSNTDIDEVAVTVETEEGGLSMKTQMRMKRLAFSSFAQFVDTWDPWVAVHDDELTGRFHANSMINIMESRGVKPRFHGKVTTASYDINTRGSWPFFDEKAVFLGGLETGVKAINLPRALQPRVAEGGAAPAHFQEFSGNTRITFRADGSFHWQDLDTNKAGDRALPEEAFYIVGARKRKLRLRGVVNGNVLVYSREKIIIDGDLTYARLPGASNVADDYLGIVSDNDIRIAAPAVTGPGDLTICASIYARRRFVVRNLYGHGKAKLKIVGSLTAGSLSATEPRYSTHIQFDKRLEGSRPPSFPLTDRYEVSAWDAAWRVGGGKP